MVVGGIGVEVGACALDRQNTQQPGIGELMQRVVDGGERNGDAGSLGFLMQLFS